MTQIPLLVRHAGAALVLLAILCAAAPVAVLGQVPSLPPLRGDVDQNGVVTVADALAILNHLAGQELPAGYRLGRVADADGDGLVTAADAAAIAEFAVDESRTFAGLGQPLVTAFLTPAEATVSVGHPLRILARVEGTEDQDVRWRSETPDVATVDSSGTVLPVAPGRAVIVAVPPADTTGAARAVLEVRRAAVASLVAGIDSVLLAVGDTLAIPVTVLDSASNPLPAYAVEWRSSDAERLPVTERGVVRAFAPGSFSIVVSGSDLADTVGVRVVLLLAPLLPETAGTATSADARVRVRAPAGAVSRPAVLWVEPAEKGTIPDSVFALSSHVYRLGVDGAPLDRAVALEVEVGTTELPPGLSTADLGLYSPEGAGWERLPPTATGERTTVIAGSVPGPGLAAVMPVARRVVVNADNSVPRYATLQLSSEVYGASDLLLWGRPVSWSSSDERIATVDEEGLLTAHAEGTAVISATRGTAQDVKEVMVTPAPPAELLPHGSPLEGMAGEPLDHPAAVRVIDERGEPIAGLQVTWSAAAGGSMSPSFSTTDEEGVAATVWTLGPGAGEQRLAATLAGLTISVAAVALPGPPAALEPVAGGDQEAMAESWVAVRPSVRVQDRYGNPVAGAGVEFRVRAGEGTVAGASVQSDATGSATVGGWRLGATAGANTLEAVLADPAAPGEPATFQATALPRCTALAALSGSGGVDSPGSIREVGVAVTDASGAPCPGVRVAWAVDTGSGTVSPGEATTDGAGVASARWSLGSEAGPQSLRATAAVPGEPGAVFVVTVTHPEPGYLIDVVRDFGARADGTSNDEPSIQAALDAAAARPGGAMVYLPEGTYGIASPLIVRSGVHLSGAGAGRTVLRALVPSWGTTVDGAQVYSAIAMVAASHASVTNLTVDFSWASTHSNGISALPDGEGYAGTPTTDSEISNVEVIGGGNYHAYMIWNLRGERIRILGNRIDGRVEPGEPSAHEGIETSGGRDVVIRGNEVRNIGLNGIFAIASETHDQERIEIVDNHVVNTTNGITVTQLLSGTGSGARDTRDLVIERNRVERSAATGILVQLLEPAELHGLTIRGNRIVDVGGSEAAGDGIRIGGAYVLSRSPDRVSGLLIEDNVVRGASRAGVHTRAVPKVTLRANDLDGSGMIIHGGDSITIVGNVVRGARESGIWAWWEPTRAYVAGNTIIGWGRAEPGAPGVLIENAAGGEVRGNRFSLDGASAPAVSIRPSSSGVILFANELLSPWGSTPPFDHRGEGANAGTVTLAPGATSAAVDSPLVGPGSRIRLVPVAGRFTRASAEAGEGRFVVEVEDPSAEGVTLWYEIDP
jgi:hypothetical protein